jgi:hypothetical protein
METVVVFPVLMLLVLVGFHMAALVHAGHVAQLASSRGAHLAAVGVPTHGNTTMVSDEIARVGRELGASFARQPHVERRRDHVVVSVRVLSPRIVPFLPAVAESTSRRTVEGFLGENER